MTVTDSATPTPDTASTSLTLAVDATPSLTIPPVNLPDAVQDVSYSQSLAATGGSPPYTWSVSAGTLPAGLSLDPGSGIISGTPAGSGQFSFTAEVTDSSSPTPQTATQAVSLTVDPVAPLTITTTALAPAAEGHAYAQTLGAAGGSGAITWSVTAGQLPAGLSLVPRTGVIRGTPTSSGTTTLTVTATDSSTPTPQTASAQLSLEVIPLTPQSISFTPPVSGAYGQTLTLSATGGRSGKPVIFSVDPTSGTRVCRVSGVHNKRLRFTNTGTCIIDANQAGNTRYAPAPQVQIAIPVTKAATTTTLTLSSSTATFGQEETLIFSFNVSPQFTGTPNGTVTILAGSTKLCLVRTLSHGNGTCSPASSQILQPGQYTVTATYHGSTLFTTSASPGSPLTIQP